MKYQQTYHGPRVWSRGEVRTVLEFAGVSENERQRTEDLMRFMDDLRAPEAKRDSQGRFLPAESPDADVTPISRSA